MSFRSCTREPACEDCPAVCSVALQVMSCKTAGPTQHLLSQHYKDKRAWSSADLPSGDFGATCRICRYSLTASADSPMLCWWGMAASGGSSSRFCAMLFARSSSFLAFPAVCPSFPAHHSLSRSQSLPCSTLHSRHGIAMHTQMLGMTWEEDCLRAHGKGTGKVRPHWGTCLSGLQQ